ncbi:OVARIAN TUMOR DOMAIN-containing deubiquitinating enzyme 12-like [Ipomoea triloba]|uniref:OVARIAN TUMOR DOMAIN-containing deubiquitinating enzyme 12-like n=1 Tax=Ipomoea triloba TaxID=35885 RepID=UPI00125DD7D4|nr:OVARIAN TUMOR DOMAIN-containing deubiquitinating enzyme 12-like [Ipomoea triloba]
MITYDQDPDVVRWGLQLFDGDPYSNYYGCSITQSGPDYYQDHYFKEGIYNLASSLENNEYNACSLGEQLSQLSVAEPHSDVHPVIDHTQTPYYSQGWFSQPMGSYTFGDENGEEETTNVGPSSSCSSPREGSYSEEEWSYSLELLDEYDLDGEVGKRLNQMVPIPHIPKINGEIPSIDEATLDHQRLLDRLQMYELVESKVQGDGNCQFRALSDQFYRSTDHHKFVRQQIVNQLKSCREIYEGYVPMAYDDYLRKMSKSGEWGDHVTLQAAADLYGVKIFVITSFKDTCYIEIVPNIQKSERVIFLSFWAEVHYNSIHPEGDVIAVDSKKKISSASADEQLESQDNYS